MFPSSHKHSSSQKTVVTARLASTTGKIINFASGSSSQSQPTTGFGWPVGRGCMSV